MKIYFHDEMVFENDIKPKQTMNTTSPSEAISVISKYVGNWGGRNVTSLYLPLWYIMKRKKSAWKQLLQCLDVYAENDNDFVLFSADTIILNFSPLYSVLAVLLLLLTDNNVNSDSGRDYYGDGVTSQDIRLFLEPFSGVDKKLWNEICEHYAKSIQWAVNLSKTAKIKTSSNNLVAALTYVSVIGLPLEEKTVSAVMRVLDFHTGDNIILPGVWRFEQFVPGFRDAMQTRYDGNISKIRQHTDSD